MAYHHTPRLLRGGPTDILQAVHVVDALVASAPGRAGSLLEERLLDLPFLESAGQTAHLPEWRELVGAEMRGMLATE